MNGFTFEEGKCGESSRWYFSQLFEKLTIIGFGNMHDFSYEDRYKTPWYKYKEHIKTIEVSYGISRVGKRCFYGLDKVEQVHCADTVQEIGERSFAYCTSLKDIALPSGLKRIGKQAFRKCTNIAELVIVSPEYIADDAFRDCDPLQKITKQVTDRNIGKVVTIDLIAPLYSQIEKEVFFEDFVVLASMNRCINNNHSLETIRAKIGVLRKNGDIVDVVIPAGYCCECDRYFIGVWHYQELRAKGVPLCKVMQENTYYASLEDSRYSDYNAWSEESFLHMSGYNVSAEDGLSDLQRRQILILLIETGYSKYKILDHISWLIRKNEGKLYMDNAVSKWKSDLGFIENYNIGSQKIIGIRSLRCKRYMK